MLRIMIGSRPWPKFLIQKIKITYFGLCPKWLIKISEQLKSYQTSSFFLSYRTLLQGLDCQKTDEVHITHNTNRIELFFLIRVNFFLLPFTHKIGKIGRASQDILYFNWDPSLIRSLLTPIYLMWTCARKGILAFH